MNLAILSNMTNDELLKVCVFKKPVSEMNDTELLISALASRLESSDDEIVNAGDTVEMVKEMRETTKELCTSVDTLLEKSKELNEKFKLKP